ncbi:MAG: hypothetical protein CM1200mP41_27330 [Gammaproteobacteria bacterium]|nr:MAG: hypothetical protein CM1200mP41_27330 [Gammaproteobacteria bacterium]
MDPHAADVVFRSGVPLTMMGLDVTHQVLVTPERIETIRSCGGQTARVVADLLSFYCRYDRSRYGTEVARCTIRVDRTSFGSALFACRHVNVQIEIASPLTLGQTVADWWQATEAQPNCHVAYAVDVGRFSTADTEAINVAMSAGPSVLVFGSVNVDLVMRVSTLPISGETVLTDDYQTPTWRERCKSGVGSSTSRC